MNSWTNPKASSFVQIQGGFSNSRKFVKDDYWVHPIISKHTSPPNLMTQQHRPFSSTRIAWFMHTHSPACIYIHLRVMMVMWCGIYNLSLPHHITRRDIMWTLSLIHEPVCLAMGFNPCSFAGICEFSLRACATNFRICEFSLRNCVSNFLHRVEEIAVNKVIRMSRSAAWRHGPDQCHCSACALLELKADLGDQRDELELQRAKIAQLETKLEEQTQKHDKKIAQLETKLGSKPRNMTRRLASFSALWTSRIEKFKPFARKITMFHQDSGTRVRCSRETHRRDVWEHPPILGKFMGKFMGVGMSGSLT